MYRSVCRLLFPEIERVARVEIYEAKIGHHITSQRDLPKMAGQPTPGELQLPGPLTLSLFKKLENHLYGRIKTEEDRASCVLDAVPNRHAALHGIVSYSSMQNSLNTIFITEYIFQIIHYCKGASRKNIVC